MNLSVETAGPIKAGFIVGPTASGKSDLALDVAQRLGAEIVNADSRQLYRGMDIGTAKPTAHQRARVPHHMIDVAPPDEPLDVVKFCKLAREAIAQIAARGRPVLVTGGSGLYLRVLRHGILRAPAADTELRRSLIEEAQRLGGEHLHRELARVDPQSAARLHPRDLYRVVRALEVYRAGGIALTSLIDQHRFADSPYQSLVVGLAMDRERLYRAIDERLDAMVEAGLEAEVRELLARGVRRDSAPMRAIGYRHIAAALAGEMSIERALELAKRDSRRLAKRQLTWFRSDPTITWIDAEEGREQAVELFASFFGAV